MKFVSVCVMMMICLFDLIDYDVIQVKSTYHSCWLKLTADVICGET